jgi:hypothetical protein
MLNTQKFRARQKHDTRVQTNRLKKRREIVDRVRKHSSNIATKDLMPLFKGQ